MNIAYLKAAIKDLPDHMEVFIKQVNDEYSLSMVQEAKVTEASFESDDENEEDAVEDVFLLTDDL